MSREAVSKGNSTRLPPRANARRAPEKTSKAQSRATMEKEANQREELETSFLTGIERLVDVLGKGGVQKECLDELLNQLSPCNIRDDGAKPSLGDTIERLSNADSVLSQAWSYSLCYPSMDINALVSVLDTLRSLVIDFGKLAAKPGKSLLSL